MTDEMRADVINQIMLDLWETHPDLPLEDLPRIRRPTILPPVRAFSPIKRSPNQKMKI